MAYASKKFQFSIFLTGIMSFLFLVYVFLLQNSLRSMGVTNVETDVKTSFNVYPNPVQNGIFTIESNKNIQAQAIAIYDLAGRMVPFSINGFGSKYSINMSNNAKGMYQLKVGSSFAKITVQ